MPNRFSNLKLLKHWKQTLVLTTQSLGAWGVTPTVSRHSNRSACCRSPPQLFLQGTGIPWLHTEKPQGADGLIQSLHKEPPPPKKTFWSVGGAPPAKQRQRISAAPSTSPPPPLRSPPHRVLKGGAAPLTILRRCRFRGAHRLADEFSSIEVPL